MEMQQPLVPEAHRGQPEARAARPEEARADLQQPLVPEAHRGQPGTRLEAAETQQLAQEVGRQAEEAAAPLAARRQAPGIRRGVLSKAVRAQPAEAAPPQQEMPGAEALRMA